MEKVNKLYFRPMKFSSTRAFRLVAYWEGVSFLILLIIAMPLKYMFQIPQAVSIIGMGHGVLTVAYVWLALQLFQQKVFTFYTFILSIFMIFIPVGTFWFVKKHLA